MEWSSAAVSSSSAVSSPQSSSEENWAANRKRAGGNVPREKTIEQRYTKLSQLEHVLTRPDSYVGSTGMESGQAWVWDEVNERMVFRSIEYVPALYKIFDEIVVNAADVRAREIHENRGRKGQRMTKLEIVIATDHVSVLNDGSGIPVEIHKDHGIYVPELIFGHLLTSDNYDDSEQRVTGGRNGYGAKLTNIFSKKFTVECVDSQRRRRFHMEWYDNMSRHTDAAIIPCDTKTDSCRVTFYPDFNRFKMEGGFTPDILALFQKRAYDMAGTIGVRVVLNRTSIPIKSFKDYVDLYFKKSKASSDAGGDVKGEATESNRDDDSEVGMAVESDDDDDDISEGKGKRKKGKEKLKKEEGSSLGQDGAPVKIYERINELWEVVISMSDGQFQQVSFVNNICTSKGGTHVNYIVDPVVQAVLKKVGSKNKGGMELKTAHVRNHLFVFLNCRVVNPTFDSQTKEYMTLSMSYLKPPVSVSDKTISLVVKSAITETVLMWAQTKQEIELKRKMRVGTGRGGRDRIIGIPKLEDANDAGTKHSHMCTLILTEGDSAKTSCVAGLSVVGKDRYGVFPLRGKVLNVRDAGFKSLTDNKELQNIMRITGLEVGKKFTDPKGLRYGSIMIMTDQDYDGSHIKGLLINMLQHFWPDLLKYKGFLKEFVTPIVKATDGKTVLPFFTMTQYEQWKKSSAGGGRNWKIKYYKGLGTSDDKEFMEYFKHLNDHSLQFVYRNEDDFEAIDMAFNAKRSEDRKNWISSFEEGTFLDHTEKDVRYKDFINKELVLFSRYDLERSIPCIVDGLKPAQRKAIFGAFKKGLIKKEMKVAQFAAYVSDISCYHHGEESMAQTAVNLAQTFVGSNNLNLFQPIGQFGSRKEGGKDASATRYIYTKLTPVARALFRTEDEPVLHYKNEEGKVIEPKWYVPILPLVLVNGSEGIGTGWSSSIPNYNPKEIIENIFHYLDGKAMVPMMPWYRGFIGTMNEVSKANAKSGFEAVGIVEKIDDTTLFISELPVKVWTQPYKEFLEEMIQANIESSMAASNTAAAKAKAKAKAKSKAGARATGRGAGASATAAKPPAFMIQDYRDNCTHQSIAFTLKLSPEYMAYAESQGLEKILRLRKSIATSNMTLFNADGHVIRYDSELDILRDFCKTRLEFYCKRRRYKLTSLEKELCYISNQLRFVLAVIDGSLTISNKRRALLEEELDERKFDRSTTIEERYDTTNRTLAGEVADDGTILDPDAEREEEQDESKVNPTKGTFQYLLSMPLYQLTLERVEELKTKAGKKEAELEKYRGTTPEALWKEDLYQLGAAIEQLEEDINADRIESENARRHAAGLIGSEFKTRQPKRGAKSQTGRSQNVKSKVIRDSSSDADDTALFAKLRQAAVKSERTFPELKSSEPKSENIPSKNASSRNSSTTSDDLSKDFGLMDALRSKILGPTSGSDSLSESSWFKTEMNKGVVTDTGAAQRKRPPPSAEAPRPKRPTKKIVVEEESDGDSVLDMIAEEDENESSPSDEDDVFEDDDSDSD